MLGSSPRKRPTGASPAGDGFAIVAGAFLLAAATVFVVFMFHPSPAADAPRPIVEMPPSAPPPVAAETPPVPAVEPIAPPPPVAAEAPVPPPAETAVVPDAPQPSPPLAETVVPPPPPEPVVETVVEATATETPEPAAETITPAPDVAETVEEVPAIDPLAGPRAVAAEVEAVPGCARLRVEETTTGETRVRGWVDGETRATETRARLLIAAGIRPIEIDLSVLPEPLCRVATMIDESPARAPDAAPTIALNHTDGIYRDGDALSVTVTAGEHGGALSVDCFDAGGNVVHMAPVPGSRVGRLEPGASVTLGAERAGDADNRRVYTVSRPGGPGMIVALLTDTPLLPTERPEAEAVSNYADELREALRGAVSRNARVTVAVVHFTTIVP